MNYFKIFSKYITIYCAVRGEYWKILCFSFCTSKYYPHICSAKHLTECYPCRELRLMLMKYNGPFLCPYISFSWHQENDI